MARSARNRLGERPSYVSGLPSQLEPSVIRPSERLYSKTEKCHVLLRDSLYNAEALRFVLTAGSSCEGRRETYEDRSSGLFRAERVAGAFFLPHLMF